MKLIPKKCIEELLLESCPIDYGYWIHNCFRLAGSGYYWPGAQDRARLELHVNADGFVVCLFYFDEKQVEAPLMTTLSHAQLT